MLGFRLVLQAPHSFQWVEPPWTKRPAMHCSVSGSAMHLQESTEAISISGCSFAPKLDAFGILYHQMMSVRHWSMQYICHS